LRKHFAPVAFTDYTYAMNNEPAYFGSSVIAWRTAALVERALPQRMGSMLYIFMRKQP
jgi:hypothetical protein